MTEKSPWHLSRTFLITLLIGVIGNLATFIWVASAANSQLDKHETWIERHTTAAEEIKETLHYMGLDIATIMERTKDL